MQNRFKYRVKFETDGQVEIFDVTKLDMELGQVFFKREDGQYYNIGIGCKDVELIQSTGLQDKNGKLIYEGDIVQFYDDEFLKTMKIVWDDDELDFKAIGLKKSVECYGQDFLYLGYIKKEDSLKVIRNIYQDSLKEES